MPVLIVADSRGRGLQHRFDKLAPGVITVSTNPGCNLKRLFKRADRHINQGNYNVVIIMGGICSITYRDHIDGLVKLGSHDVELYMQKITKSINFGLDLIQHNHPRTKVIVAPTMGVDLARYNKSDWDQYEQQVLNDIIVQVNKTIIELNSQHAQIPWISAWYIDVKGKAGGHIDTTT